MSVCRDESTAIEVAVERAAEAIEAEIGALVRGDEVVFAIGFRADELPRAELCAAAVFGGVLHVDRVGPCRVLSVPVDERSHLLLARAGDGFTREEASLTRGMGRVLALTLRMLGVLSTERSLREESQRQQAELRDRQVLTERLFDIQRLISGRAPTDVVFTAIVNSAAALFGDEVVGLRLIDDDDPTMMNLVACVGVSDETRELIKRSPIGEGVGGRAIIEGRLVATTDYASFPRSIPAFVQDSLGSAMAAPVGRDGRIVGSLVVACHRSERGYSERERDALRSLAEHVSLALNDESSRRAIDQALGDAVHQATHDSLSGLPNRMLVVDRLEHALARAKRGTFEVGVLFIDLDRFKQVNDSLGHGIGDEVLAEVARRLASATRPGDTVGRLAGDEFLVICEDLSLERTVQMAERLADELAAPMNIYGRETVLTASIGVAHADTNGKADEMLRNADVAMYRAKERGRARIEVFDHEMRNRVLERIEVEQALRRAIRKNELRVHYQPIFSLRSRRIISVEALVRWQRADGRLVQPDDFIALAEDTGLIVPLGSWVLNKACHDVARWRSEFPAFENLAVTVNLSGRQFADPGLPDAIETALIDSGLPERALALEITESVLMDEADCTIDTLTRLKKLGVRLVVDDFGTGYSSLSYLRRFPVNALKIDRSFVSELDPDTDDDAIVTAILGMAKALDLLVVAEGIETEAQLEMLRRWDCHYGQGFALARPMVEADFLAAYAHNMPVSA